MILSENGRCLLEIDELMGRLTFADARRNCLGLPVPAFLILKLLPESKHEVLNRFTHSSFRIFKRHARPSHCISLSLATFMYHVERLEEIIHIRLLSGNHSCKILAKPLSGLATTQY